MGKYTVTAGQNIFDIAMHLSGSVEGIVDLMMSNPGLSFATGLKTGDELEFTDGFVINPDIVAHFRMNHIIPANGERNVYYKSSAFRKIFKIWLSGRLTSARFLVSGTGMMEIDWGDNSQMETVMLSGNPASLFHTFDGAAAGIRKIVIYGDFSIKQLDFTDLRAEAILLFSPLSVEKFMLRDCKINMDFIALLKDVYEISLSGLKTASLLPLIENKNLMKLDLSDICVSQGTLDEYLIALVKNHCGRRSCTVMLTMAPSGRYREPDRDFEGDYDIAGGMEALWLLCNEPSWNEAGYWKFIIADTVYTSENNS